MKDNKFTAFLLTTYILLIGIQEPYHLPLLEGKIQLCDIWFLIMLIYAFISWHKFISRVKILVHYKTNRYFIVFGVLYLFAITISIIHSYSHSGLIELMGKCYLLIMSIMVLILLIPMENEKFLNITFQSFNLLGISLATIGILGWILSILGVHNETTQIYLDYPYFGDTHRLKALTTTPSMYISIITICTTFSLCNHLFYQKTKFQLFSCVFFTIAAFLTFTKSFLFILAAWIILFLFKYCKNKATIILTFVCFLILQAVLTHFLIIPTENIHSDQFQSSPYTSNEIIYQGQDITVIGSGYYTFKKTAWKLFNEYPSTGVGPGNYNLQVAKLKEEGFYPANLANYDPHSTYLGALAETGLLGFISLMMLGLFIAGLFLKMEIKMNPFSFTLFLIFSIQLAEGISMDTMNFRHYWVLAAIILIQYLNINTNKKVVAID